MAQPSSAHRERERERDRDHDRRTERTERTTDRDRDREERHRERDRAERRAERESRSSRTHHHHRTVSSTTLLLVLSLVLAVLAVMLSLPSGGLPAVGGTPENPDGSPQKGVWGILTPKRSSELVRRETDVAKREAEVARREAEMLAGAPGGVLPPQQAAPPPPMQIPCPVCPTMVIPEPMTVIKEVVRETEALAAPGWFDEGKMRFQDILDRELKIADREREIGRREEQVNRREHDASRRETWIMEQLVAIGNEEQPVVEEEYVYDTPRQIRRTPKYLPIEQELPPLIFTETAIATEYHTVTHTQHHTHTLPSHTVTVPAPAATQVAHVPTPEPHTVGWTTAGPRTTSVQIIHEQIIEEPVLEPVVLDVVEETTTKTRLAAQTARPPPKRWSGW